MDLLPEEEEEKPISFSELGLDDRILEAITKLRWLQPTLVQEKAIPLLLEGKDVLLKARTGSGKTAAFAIPAIQNVLNSKQVAREQAVSVLVLAPTRELCEQIHRNFVELTIKCSRSVNCIDISKKVDIIGQRSLLITSPDVIVATPSRALAHIKAKSFNLASLNLLVIDEADLVFSFGYENEIKELLRHLPPIFQAALASATLSEDVLKLKKLILHNPVTLKLQEPEMAPASQLTHFLFSAEEQDKAVILYTLLKLNLIKGKSIIFVNTVDKSYKLKLFLEQFGIRSCVLNSELPSNVRCHSIGQFNRGVYDIIVASDEQSLEKPSDAPKQRDKKSARRKDKESGVARGIDFQCVSNVLNFDFPLDVNAFIHRAGRTARGNNKGATLSLASLKEKPLVEKVEEALQPSYGNEKVFMNYEFRMDEVEGFRYRSRDAWRSVTRIAVREARLKEIKQEILNSQTLKGYFVDNPQDFKTLRHDKALHTVKIQHHLADVPEYLVPSSLKNITGGSLSRKRKHPGRTGNATGNPSRAQRHSEAVKSNPLLSFEFAGFKKKKEEKKKKKKKKKKEMN